MLTVEADPDRVERRLAAGGICCPSCSSSLAPWGWARCRVLRGFAGVTVRLQPRRVICPRCLVTHVLLPVVALSRRADLVEVIGAALLAKAAGRSLTAIAVWLGRAVDTVRGWLRRLRGRAEELRVAFDGAAGRYRAGSSGAGLDRLRVRGCGRGGVGGACGGGVAVAGRR